MEKDVKSEIEELAKLLELKDIEKKKLFTSPWSFKRDDDLLLELIKNGETLKSLFPDIRFSSDFISDNIDDNSLETLIKNNGLEAKMRSNSFKINGNPFQQNSSQTRSETVNLTHGAAPKISKPPFSFLITLAEIFPEKQCRNLKEEISDLRIEYNDALFEKKKWRAHSIVIFYYVGIAWSILKWVAKLIKDLLELMPKVDQ